MRARSTRRGGVALVAGLVVVLALGAVAQTGAPAREPIGEYIHRGWDTLSRSMSECKSVVDPKVTTVPILYLPYGMEVPAAVKAMQRGCKVEVMPLPRRIARMGDVRVAEIPKEGLLYLPNRYVVPGGRFNEMYGWDTYFIVLGLLKDGRVPLAQGIVENFFFEIANYGGVLNANRTYYFTRSQPPLLSSMIEEVYARTKDKTWLGRAYGYGERDYGLWAQAPHLAGGTGLARYDDLGDGPVPEMADDSTYYPDVVRWLEGHPELKTDYLVEGTEHPSAAEAARLATSSCDVRRSKVCAAAYADGHRLSAAYFHGDRAMRESGFDTSFRFGPFSGSTEEYAPVGLNSLLYKYAEDMAGFAKELGRTAEVGVWERRAEERKAAVNRLMWDREKGMFYDVNWVTGKRSSYDYLTTFYPLWSGLATPEQAAAVRSHLDVYEHAGGVAMSANDSGTQWDLPYGWAPTHWFAAEGLARYGFAADAERVAEKFRTTVLENYERDGTIREKYDVVSGTANVRVAAGYKANVIGFGWTNGVYVSLAPLVQGAKDGAGDGGTLLGKEELGKLIPATVFFRGQTATVQLRNAGGVRFANGMEVLAVKVDTGGYASNVQDRYQDYLIAEVPLVFGGQRLAPGAYGVGFLDGKFLVMDVGGHTVLTVGDETDGEMRRPVPLQMVAAPAGGGYRLYSGRTYVGFRRAAEGR